MAFFKQQRTEAEKLFDELAGIEREKSFWDSFRREKNYVDVSKLTIEGYTLNWETGSVDLEISLNEFWDKDYDLYKRAGINIFNLFRFVPTYASDKKLGETKAIFQYEDGFRFFLEYEPKILRSGNIRTLQRSSIPLVQQETKLLLPSNYYLIKN